MKARVLQGTVLSVLLAVSAYADVQTNTWIEGSSDWSKPESYEENRTLNLGDIVIIPAGVTAYVTNAASYAVVTNLSWIRFAGANSKIVFDVPEGEHYGVACTIRYPNTATEYARYGEVIKRGKGELEFAVADHTYARSYMLWTAITVEEGTFVLPQNYRNVTSPINYKCNCLCGVVSVSNEAVFVTAGISDANSSIQYGVTEVRELWGEGVVTNRCASQQRLQVNGKTNMSEFKGRIVPRIRWHQGGYLRLTGTNSTLTGYFTLHSKAICEFLTAGESTSVPSSIGKCSFQWRDGATYRYIGANETTSKGCIAQSTTDMPATFDAGETGGLTFTSASTWTADTDQDQTFHRLVLTGNNTNVCEIAGSLDTWSVNNSVKETQISEEEIDNGDGTTTTNVVTNVVSVTKSFPATYVIAKRGTGTWKFSNAANPWSGALYIENGTIQATSLANIGSACSLGTAVNRTAFKTMYGSVASTSHVDYAICLGSAATPGTLEYVGDASATVANRPIALAGKGGHLKVSSNAPVTYCGVTAQPGVDAALTFSGGASDVTNVICDVCDGGGKVSLVKEGDGNWMLGGTNDFSGTLAVNGGTLYVKDPATKYSWFRWTLKDRNTTSATADANVRITELGIWDEDGNRMNGGLIQSTTYSYTRPGTLEEGMCAFDRSGTHWKSVSGTTYPLDALFDDMYTRTDGYSTIAQIAMKTNNATVYVNPEIPSSWIPVVMHLTNTTARAASIDLVQGIGSSSGNRQYKTFGVEGSSDGIHWDSLTNITVTSFGQTKWSATGGAYTRGTSDTHKGGYPIAGGPTNAVPALANVESVSVAAGARLVSLGGTAPIKGLTVDANGAGTIENFSFAEKGAGNDCALDVTNITPAGGVLPGTYVNCTGLENVARWSLKVGGTKTSKMHIVVEGGKIRIEPIGLIMTIR